MAQESEAMELLRYLLQQGDVGFLGMRQGNMGAMPCDAMKQDEKPMQNGEVGGKHEHQKQQVLKQVADWRMVDRLMETRRKKTDLRAAKEDVMETELIQVRNSRAVVEAAMQKKIDEMKAREASMEKTLQGRREVTIKRKAEEKKFWAAREDVQNKRQKFLQGWVDLLDSSEELVELTKQAKVANVIID